MSDPQAPFHTTPERPVSPIPPSRRTHHVTQLKTSVDLDAYVIDPVAVAEALLRRTDPRRDPVLLPPVIRPRARSRSAAEDRPRP